MNSKLEFFKAQGVDVFNNPQELDLFFLAIEDTQSNNFRGRQILKVFECAKKEFLVNPSWKSRLALCLEEYSKLTDGISKWEQDLVLKSIDFIDPDLWTEKIREELKWENALEDLHEGARDQASVAYRPLGRVLHIAAGNSFWAGWESLCYGLVAGNQNILRISKNAAPICSVLIDLLKASGLPKNQAQVVYWNSSDHEIQKAVLERIDAVALWGSDELIASYRGMAPVGVKLIEFGPKLSLSIATQSGVLHGDFSGVVRDVCEYEQSSCSSTQVLFVEIPKVKKTPLTVEVNISTVLDRLASSFQTYSKENPTNQKTPHAQVEILKVLERAKIEKIKGAGDFRSGYPDWLVVHKCQSQIEPSPLFRTLYVYAYSDLLDLESKVKPIRRYLQTATLLTNASEKMELANLLWNNGVTRVTDAGQSSSPKSISPHDGESTLLRFLRTVSFESSSENRFPWALGSESEVSKRREKTLYLAGDRKVYADKLARVGGDFKKMDWLKKEDLYQYGPPQGALLTGREFLETTGAYIFTTGGSTGAPKYTFFTHEEWEEVTDAFARQYEILGIQKSDRVVNLFVGGGLWSAFIAVSRGLEKVGCVNLALGGDTEPKQALEIFKRFKVTTLIGLPSTILKLAHALEENPDKDVQISKVLYKGESMSVEMRAYVKRIFGAQLVKSGGYAAVDAGTVGYQCLHAEGGVHHVLERYCQVEICDAETGEIITDNRPGEIIVTNFNKTLLPIIRLKTGDQGRWVLESCACGTPAKSFELMGRTDDMVRAGGANIFISDIDKLVQQFGAPLSFITQLELSRIGIDDKVTLNIELAHALGDLERSQLTVKVIDKYFNIATELKSYLDSHSLRHFQLNLLDPGTIKSHPKTRKIRRVIDHRFSS